MKLPNNKGDRGTTEHFLSPKEASSTRNALRLIEFFAKVVQGNLQTTQPIARALVVLYKPMVKQGPIAEENTDKTP